jgi:hypothetical protein
MKIITTVSLVTFVFTYIVISTEVCYNFGILYISIDPILLYTIM